MCRILALRSSVPLDATPFLEAFARRCRASKEFQGDGWGVAWWDGEAWRSWRAVTPIWDTELPPLPRSGLWLAHARSAFRNEGVVVENNMPFVEGTLAFAFNGELRGVRLQAPGSTGAWRLFHLLRRFASTARLGEALGRLDAVVTSRSDYVRALNMVVSDGDQVWINSRFGEDPEYFTLWSAVAETVSGTLEVAASEPLDLGDATSVSWTPVAQGATVELGEGSVRA